MSSSTLSDELSMSYSAATGAKSNANKRKPRTVCTKKVVRALDLGGQLVALSESHGTRTRKYKELALPDWPQAHCRLISLCCCLCGSSSAISGLRLLSVPGVSLFGLEFLRDFKFESLRGDFGSLFWARGLFWALFDMLSGQSRWAGLCMPRASHRMVTECSNEPEDHHHHHHHRDEHRLAASLSTVT
eukprot:3642046-Rhodomonas_salina.1